MNKNKQIVKVGGAAVALGAAFGIGIPVGKSMQNTPESSLMEKITAMSDNLEAAIGENNTNTQESIDIIKDQLYLNNEMLNKEITKINDTLWRSHDKQSGDLNNLAEDLYKMRKDLAMEVKHILNVINRNKPQDILRPLNDLSTAITKNSDKLSQDINHLVEDLYRFKKDQAKTINEIRSDISEEFSLNDELLMSLHDNNKPLTSGTDLAEYQEQTHKLMLKFTEYIRDIIYKVEQDEPLNAVVIRAANKAGCRWIESQSKFICLKTSA